MTRAGEAVAAAAADVEFTLDGRSVRCPAGLTVAGALFHLGLPPCRRTLRSGEPRAPFCGMGVCGECLMRIDGRPSVRACVTLVVAGMEVATLDGVADLEGLR